jgi:pimeloyl-ACP methyl ester carboxylesterase
LFSDALDTTINGRQNVHIGGSRAPTTARHARWVTTVRVAPSTAYPHVNLTSPSALAGSAALAPSGTTAQYSFQVSPTLATRYTVQVFPNSTATTPLATSATRTVYVIPHKSNTKATTCSSTQCQVTDTVTDLVPASALSTEMADHWYTYFGISYSASGTPSAPATLQLGAGTPVVGAPHQVSADELSAAVVPDAARTMGLRRGRAGRSVGRLRRGSGVGREGMAVARIVCVHGVGQQLAGEESLAGGWAPALRDGMRRAGCAEQGLPGAGEIGCVFYGDVFRPAGRRLAVGDPWLRAADADEFDQELLAAWWRGAAESDPRVVHPDARTLARTPGGVQAALRALSGSVFFAGLADRVMLSDLAQVRRYMTDPQVRQAVLSRVAARIGEDTRVVVGHSLGSVVAYEALCAHPEWPVRALVTLGSPLGIRNLIFDRLSPAPATGSSGEMRGVWPGAGRSWVNVADAGDVVALVKDLRPLFGARVACYVTVNGSHAHDVLPYLTAAETGAAIAAGLAAGAGQ